MNFKPNEEDIQHSQIIGQNYDDMAEDWRLDALMDEANEAEDSKIMELEGLTDDD
ncbi:hypothetical protein ACRWXZ_18885 [Escherichia coli]|uniref:hypothetical protein n=1 Tax=Escherichia coli TaxID=562 RepID=UPI0016055669|nr:hypothetical protein [Escherichia coli]